MSPPTAAEAREAIRQIEAEFAYVRHVDAGLNFATLRAFIASAEQVVAEIGMERDKYRNGNTTLLELLMKLCCGEHTSVLKEARDILLGAGLMNADYTPNWQALEDRKPKPQTWEQAVRECVTDPAEVERLLALADDATPEQVHAAARAQPAQGKEK
jgi:hypothetical protein